MTKVFSLLANNSVCCLLLSSFSLYIIGLSLLVLPIGQALALVELLWTFLVSNVANKLTISSLYSTKMIALLSNLFD